MIQPDTSRYEAVYPSISFSDFTKHNSTADYSLKNNQFLFLVKPDNFNGLWFTLIRVFCNTSGNPINLTQEGIHYSYRATFVKTPAYLFGFILKDSVDSNQHSWFAPLSDLNDGYCEVRLLVNSNYVTLDGITF